MSFLPTTTVFGTPREVIVSKLAIEVSYPADHVVRITCGVSHRGERGGGQPHHRGTAQSISLCLTVASARPCPKSAPSLIAKLSIEI